MDEIETPLVPVVQLFSGDRIKLVQLSQDGRVSASLAAKSFNFSEDSIRIGGIRLMTDEDGFYKYTFPSVLPLEAQESGGFEVCGTRVVTGLTLKLSATTCKQAVCASSCRTIEQVSVALLTVTCDRFA